MKRYRKRATLRKKRATKKRMAKKIRIMRPFFKGGIIKKVFEINSAVGKSTDIGSIFISWLANYPTTLTYDISHSLHFIKYRELFQEMRIRGVKITFIPVSFANEQGGRTIKLMEIGSWPYKGSEDMAAFPPAQSDMVQRLDYHCWNGNISRISRYYRVGKVAKKSARYFTPQYIDARNSTNTGTISVINNVKTDTALTENGWMPTQYTAYGKIDKGVTCLRLTTANFSGGDMIGMINIKYYCEFKNPISQAGV